MKGKVNSLELKLHNINENQSKCLVEKDELLNINSNLSNENEEVKKRIRELELKSLASNLGKNHQILKENINVLEKRLSEAKSFHNLEKINRNVEKEETS